MTFSDITSYINTGQPTLSFGSIEADNVVSEPSYNIVTYYMHIAK